MDQDAMTLETRTGRDQGRARLGRILASALLAVALITVSFEAWAEIRSVKVASANFRKAPSRESAVLFTADRFYPVEILKKKQGWLRVRDFEGDVAWVAEWVLSTKLRTVVVTRELINIRKKPTKDANIVHKAEKGAVFKVAGNDGKWVRVADGQRTIGWVRNDLLWGHTPAVKKPKK